LSSVIRFLEVIMAAPRKPRAVTKSSSPAPASAPAAARVEKSSRRSRAAEQASAPPPSRPRSSESPAIRSPSVHMKFTPRAVMLRVTRMKTGTKRNVSCAPAC